MEAWLKNGANPGFLEVWRVWNSLRAPEIRDFRDLCPGNQEGDALQVVGSPLRGQGRAARMREEDGIDMNGWKPDQAAPGCFESVGFSAL